MASLYTSLDQYIKISAKIRGLGVILPMEMAAIKAQLEYDMYARDLQMPYDIAQDNAIAWRDLLRIISPARYRQIQKFCGWLQGDY